jgi:hypothetical protein
VIVQELLLLLVHVLGEGREPLPARLRFFEQLGAEYQPDRLVKPVLVVAGDSM